MSEPAVKHVRDVVRGLFDRFGEVAYELDHFQIAVVCAFLDGDPSDSERFAHFYI